MFATLIAVTGAFILAGAEAPGPIELYGETHGHTRSWQVLQTRIDALERAGTEAVLGLELSRRLQPAFDAWWQGDTAAFPETLIDEFGWCHSRDGRVSVELLRFLERNHPARGGHVRSVRFFDDGSPADPDMSVAERSGARSIAHGRNIAEIQANYPDAQVIALAGSTHARKIPRALPESYGGGEMETAGWYLGEVARTILIIHGPGEVHNCTPEGCGTRETESNASLWAPEAGIYDASIEAGPAEPITLLADAGYCAGNE